MAASAVIAQELSGTPFWHALSQFSGFVAVLLAAGPLVVLCWAAPIARVGDISQIQRRRLQWSAFVVSFLPVLVCLYASMFRQAHSGDVIEGWKPMPVYAGVLAELVASVVFVKTCKRVWPIAAAAVIVPVLAMMFVGFISLCLVGGDGP